jgi:hypothetical protein
MCSYVPGKSSVPSSPIRRGRSPPIATKAKGAAPNGITVVKGVHQIVTAPVGEHSVKPEEVAQGIERLVGGPYLELFARRLRPGWTCWGDEVPIDDADKRLLDETFTPSTGDDNRQLAVEARSPAIVASNSVRPTAPIVERLVGTTSPKIIVVTYADGTRAWRYAAERTLRYEGADEMLAAVQQQIKEKEARELDAIFAAGTSSTT